MSAPQVLPGRSGSPQQANSGGPISRRRSEIVHASLFGSHADAKLRLPRVLRAGLRFGDADPFELVLAALARAGLEDPEQLRERHAIPTAPLLMRVEQDPPWAIDATRAKDEVVLRQALLLGLCSRWQYDPARPVIWTRAALTRCVELHSPGGFYA